MTEMSEVTTVADHARAVAIVELLKAKGVSEVGFWPKDMLDSSIGILGGGPLPLQPPFRLHATGPVGPFVITVPTDLAPMARHYLESPAGGREIERLARGK